MESVCVCVRVRVWCVFILKDGFTLCKPSWDTFFSPLHTSLMSFPIPLFLWSFLLSAVWTRAWREPTSPVSAPGCREHLWRLPMPMGEHVSTADSPNTASLPTDMAKRADWCAVYQWPIRCLHATAKKPSVGLYLTAWRVQCRLSKWQAWLGQCRGLQQAIFRLRELESPVLHIS